MTKLKNLLLIFILINSSFCQIIDDKKVFPPPSSYGVPIASTLYKLDDDNSGNNFNNNQNQLPITTGSTSFTMPFNKVPNFGPAIQPSLSNNGDNSRLFNNFNNQQNSAILPNLGSTKLPDLFPSPLPNLQPTNLPFGQSTTLPNFPSSALFPNLNSGNNFDTVLSPTGFGNFKNQQQDKLPNLEILDAGNLPELSNSQSSSLPSLPNIPSLPNLPSVQSLPGGQSFPSPILPSSNLPNLHSNIDSTHTKPASIYLPASTTEAPILALPKEQSFGDSFQTHSNIHEEKLSLGISESKSSSSLHNELPLKREQEFTTASHTNSKGPQEPYFKPEIHVIHLDDYDKLNAPHYYDALRTPPSLFNTPSYYNVGPNYHHLPINTNYQQHHQPNVILYLVKNNPGGSYSSVNSYGSLYP